MLAFGDLGVLKDQDFARFLGGGPLVALGDDAALEGSEAEEEARFPRPRRALVALAALPDVNSMDIGEFQVKLDNFSHSSGKRRAYISCKNCNHNEERGCFRYRS